LSDANSNAHVAPRSTSAAGSYAAVVIASAVKAVTCHAHVASLNRACHLDRGS
jgi:hypothetical protein